MPEKYVSPEVSEDGYHCPHCGMYANQLWEKLYSGNVTPRGGKNQILEGNIGTCANCGEHTLWVGEQLVYPPTSTAPEPHEDMPEDVEADFREARQVVGSSPRSAAALLRLSMEKLTQELTGNDDSLYQNIGTLVEEERIDKRIQRALDAVRVTGNDMVHAGEIYEDDDKDIALRLFHLINTIVRLTITDEKLIEEAYSEIPENKKDGINNRDGE